jgi:hypothetical protein
MKDRRRWSRHAVAWSVELALRDGSTLVTETVDISRHGIRLALTPGLTAEAPRRGETYRFEVYLPGNQARFARSGRVRKVDQSGVRLEILDALPDAVIAPARKDDPAAPRPASGRVPAVGGLRGLLAHLRGFPAR